MFRGSWGLYLLSSVVAWASFPVGLFPCPFPESWAGCRYEEVANRALRFKDDKDKNISLAVVSLIPRLADFCPERFLSEHFTICMDHLLKMTAPKVWSNSEDHGTAFLALKETVEALRRHLQTTVLSSWLPRIVDRLSEAISCDKARKDSPCKEALEVSQSMKCTSGAVCCVINVLHHNAQGCLHIVCSVQPFQQLQVFCLAWQL